MGFDGGGEFVERNSERIDDEVLLVFVRSWLDRKNDESFDFTDRIFKTFP